MALICGTVPTAGCGGRASLRDELDESSDGLVTDAGDPPPRRGTGGTSGGGTGGTGGDFFGGGGTGGDFTSGGSGGFSGVGGSPFGGTGGFDGGGGSGGAGACRIPANISGEGAPLVLEGSLGSGTSNVEVCGGSGHEEYFVWQCPQTGSYRVDTHGSDFDTVLSHGEGVYCHLDYDPEDCNDDSNDLTSELLLNCNASEFITIAVDAFARNDGGQFRLNIENVDSPDTCPVGNLGSVLGTPVIYGVVEEGYYPGTETSCSGGSPRFGFQWEAPYSGTFQIDTYGSTYDTVLVLRDECFGEVENCNDDSNGTLRSLLTISVSEGYSMIIEIAAYGGEVYRGDASVAQYMLNINEVE